MCRKRWPSVVRHACAIFFTLTIVLPFTPPFSTCDLGPGNDIDHSVSAWVVTAPAILDDVAVQPFAKVGIDGGRQEPHGPAVDADRPIPSVGARLAPDRASRVPSSPAALHAAPLRR